MPEKQLDKVTTCFHCGNRTVLVKVAEHQHIDEEYLDDDGREVVVGVWHNDWSLWKCRSCNAITLVKQDWDTFTEDHLGNPILTETIIYPSISISDSAIPSGVASAFEAALQVRHIEPSMCLIGLRRTLDRMCKEQGEDNGTLFGKLTNLANRGILPSVVKDMADVLREVGNEAAHGDDVAVSDTQLRTMIEFTKNILDYVYVLPDKLSDIKSTRSPA